MGTLRLSVAYENIVLNASVGVAGLASLHTADPGATGANEAVGNGYARQPINFDPAAAGATDNDAIVSWTASGGNLGGGGLTHLGLWSADGTTFIGRGALSTTRTIPDGDSLEIPLGASDATVRDS